jgi:hypothetical protein
MTNGQIARLQELSKCYMASNLDYGLFHYMYSNDHSLKMSIGEKAWLRRLTHQYRNQIAAIRRNQGVR